MTPIYLEFACSDGAWSALLHPDQGRCDVWRDLVYAGTVTFGRGGFAVSAPHLREILPTLADQFRPYYPLLRHEGLLAPQSDRLQAVGASG
jgi:hypothetical protein